MDLGQGGKPRGMRPTKVLIDGRVLIQPHKLPDHLHGQHLGIRQGRGRTPLPDPVPIRIPTHLAQQRIDQAIDGYSEVLQVHGAPP